MKAASTPEKAGAYGFDWLGQAYLADKWGNYGYADLTYYWTPNAGGMIFSNVVSYRRIGSPRPGYQYNSWGAEMDAPSDEFIPESHYQLQTITYSSGPVWLTPPLGTPWANVSVTATVGACKGTSCGSWIFFPDGARLEAHKPANSTYGVCQWRQYPQQHGTC
jgi:hypothetical protein